MNPSKALPTSVGYCTNVHPGTTLDEILANLEQHVVGVRRELNLSGWFPVGLWLSESAVAELQSPTQHVRLAECFSQHQLLPRTLNGFPCGDFHLPSVKHTVYQPTWAEPRRLAFTQRLAELQAGWLGPGQSGTLSTLPLGWPQPPWTPAQFQTAADNLLEFAQYAAALFDRTGCEVRLCLEPEPGCIWSTSSDLVRFFEEYLFRDSTVESRARRFLGVCHDVCHSAVMFEPQSTSIDNYLAAGISIFKVQASAALVANLSHGDARRSSQLLEQLRRFAEPRYLHQTQVGGGPFFQDLPDALEWQGQCAADQHLWAKEWRIHFHVPLFADKLLGGLSSTQSEIRNCLNALHQQAGYDRRSWQQGDWDLEVETYAWHVLPAELQVERLPVGIAREIKWLESLLDEVLPWNDHSTG